MSSELLNGSGRHRHLNPSFPKPSVFSGMVDEWNSFIFQFCKTARCYGWDQQEKLDRLLVTLRGKGIDFIKNKPGKVQDDYRVLKIALELRFGKDNTRVQQGVSSITYDSMRASHQRTSQTGSWQRSLKPTMGFMRNGSSICLKRHSWDFVRITVQRMQNPV